jgi:hypothetical protein
MTSPPARARIHTPPVFPPWQKSTRFQGVRARPEDRAAIPLHADAATASTRKCIATMVAVSVGLTVPVVRPVARAARTVRTSATSAGAPRVAPGVGSRAALGLNRRLVRGARVIVGERKSSDSEGPLDTVQIENCLQVRVSSASRIHPHPPDPPLLSHKYPPADGVFFPPIRRVRSRPRARARASAHARPSAFACTSAKSLSPAPLHPTPRARSAG